MPTFHYSAIDAAGQAVRGSVSAPTRAGAIAALAGEGVFVTDLDADRPGAAAAAPGAGSQAVLAVAPAPVGLRRRLRPRARVALFRQLATALQAGLPLLSALQVVQEQAEKAPVRHLVADLAGRVQAGEALSQAMEAHPREFSRLEVSMVRVGETAGLLDQVMTHLAEFADHELDVREKVHSAAAYPLFVLGLALVSMVVIVTFILPRVLESVLSGAVDRPWPTTVLLAASGFLRGWGGLALLSALLGAATALRWYAATPPGRLALDGLKLRIPVLGTALRRIAVARFARTLGTLSKSGIPILEALHVLRDTLGNEALARHVDRVAAGITQGQSIADPLRRTGQFPPLLTQVIAMGERTGRLDELLLQTAQAYDKETASAIQRTMTILPAVFIVLMALVVLFVLAAVLLPIVNMNTGLPGM